MNRANDLFDTLTTKGEAAIDELIATRKAEELFLDFKRSADDGAGARLHDRDGNNFGKAISGFGNSEGGVVVWGVDCARSKDGSDVASMKVPLHDAAAFASRLEGAVSRCTIPGHSGVRSVPISRPGGSNGFVVSLIPKSNAAPHQTVPALQYYMRAGSDFVPVPHGVLAGMFGRRPEPNMGIMKIVTPPTIEGDTILFDVGLGVRNRGPGIARDIFLTLMCSSIPCRVGSLEFDSADLDTWIVVHSLGVHMSYLSKPTVRLAPDSQLMPVQLRFQIVPPFKGELDIKATVGCEGGMPHSFRFQSSAKRIEKAYSRLLAAERSGSLKDDDLRSFPRVVLGLGDKEEVHPYSET